MSAPDKINVMFKTALTLLGFTSSVLFYSIWDNTNQLTRMTNSLDGRLIKIETKLDDELAARAKDDARRDKAIEELYQMISQKGSK